MYLLPESYAKDIKIGTQLNTKEYGVVTIAEISFGKMTLQKQDKSFIEVLVWFVAGK